MKKFIKATVLALFIGVLSIIGISNVFAEGTTSTMTVSPMNQQIILTPGKTYSGTVKISNPATSQQNFDYAVKVGSFTQSSNSKEDENSSQVDTETVTKYNEIMDWVTLSPETGSVAPNDTEVVAFTIDVPADAPAGGQYFTVIFQDTTERKSDSGNVNIQDIPQVASIVYAEVAGTTDESATIFENSIPLFSFGGGISAHSMVKNEGNVHTDATYTLQVWPAFASEDSEELYTNVENPEKQLIMPETTRYVTTKWEDAPMVGIFKVKQTVSIFDQTSETTQTVIVCPMWLIFIILIAIFFIIFWFISRHRARQKSDK